MHKIRAALTAAVIAGAAVPITLAVTGPAAAQTADPCYEQVPYTERLYERDTYRTEVRYEKYVRGVTQTRLPIVGWTDDGGTFDWIDFPGAGPLDWGIIPGPLTGAHNSVFDQSGNGVGSTRKRSTHYEYRIVDTRQVVSGTEQSGWTRDSLGDPWRLVDERTGTEDGDQIACTPQPPDDFDERTETGTCDGPGDTTATVTVYRTDFTYVLSLDDDPATPEWVRTQVGDEYVYDTYEIETDACPPLPVPGAEVICVSTGPDYVSWQLTNTGGVAIVSPVAIAPGESAVIESLRDSQGSVSVDVVFADESTGTFVGSGEGCVFTPPVTTTPTTVPVTDPPVTDPPVDPTDPPVAPSTSVAPVDPTDPPVDTTLPPAPPPSFEGQLPSTL